MQEQRVEDKRVFSKIGGIYFLGGLLAQVMANVIYWLVIRVRPQWAANVNVSVIISTIGIYVIGMPLVIGLMQKIPVVPYERQAMKFHQWLGALVSCFAMGYISNFVGVFLTFCIGIVKGAEVDNPVLHTVTSLHIGVSFVCVVLIAPLVEEYVFRKVLVDRLRGYGEGMAILLSGVMFGLFHGNLNQFVYAFVLGMLFAFIYVKTGKIQYTIFIHMCINSIGGFFTPCALRMIDMEEYMRRYLLAVEYGDVNGLLTYTMDHVAGLLLLTCLGFFVIAVIVSGVIVVLLNLRKIQLTAGERSIPRGERFRTVVWNVGMMLFIVFWAIKIILQLVG